MTTLREFSDNLLASSDCVGMECPREGLNNQRIALYGLLAFCMENDKDVAIPSYCIDHTPKPFFDANGFIDMLKFYNCLAKYYIKSKAFKPRILLNQIFSLDGLHGVSRNSSTSSFLTFKQALYFGFSRLRAIADSEEHKKLFRAISFSPHLLSISTGILQLLHINGSFNCASLRLEKDWLRYINSKDFAGEPWEIPLFTPSNILNQIEELCKLTDVWTCYCCVDLDDLPFTFDKFKLEAKYRGISLVTKRDFPAPRKSAYSSLVSASIDYIIALRSVAYLGSTRSTFSNLVALDTFLSGNMAHHDYIMNKVLNLPLLRTDHGLT